MENPEIIWSENVGPSFPTHQNLRTYKLSMLDLHQHHFLPSLLSPILLYYHNITRINAPDSFISTSTRKLIESLSKILTRFYPFAGRATADGLSIDCNDAGVPFTVARFRSLNLYHLLADPSCRRFLLPCDLTKHADRSVVQIQINYFACGGAAVGAVFWRSAVDVETISAFLNAWAATAWGTDLPFCPNFISSSLFPQTEDQSQIEAVDSQLAAALLRRGKSVLRGYVFDAAAVSALRSRSGLELPTRVEAVSALLWKCFIAASRANSKSSSVLIRTVDLRRRAHPPFSSDCFGNFGGLVAAVASNDGGNDVGELVRKMRDSLGEIDGDYVSRLSGGGGISAYIENRFRMLSRIPRGEDCLHIVSMCGVGFNGVDFGWGEPIRFGDGEGSDSDSAEFANGFSLVDTSDGEGIEVVMILDERYVSAFENAHQLLRQAVRHESISKL